MKVIIIKTVWFNTYNILYYVQYAYNTYVVYWKQNKSFAVYEKNEKYFKTNL